jgi:S-adenosylmethionine:tRNA ribosyltransferase-isomerase
LISIKTSDFYFDLPSELIAQTPIPQRDASRLLTLNKKTGEINHLHFHNLPTLLNPGDCLVLNDSRVLPARLIGQRMPSRGISEVVLLTDRGEKIWECIVRPGRKLREGAQLSFGEGQLTAQVIKVLENGNRLIRFDYEGIFLEILERLGKMPLPPYIREELEDSERYQTVYSREIGSAAAPTAGLHFTKELLNRIQNMGVAICYVTLHVGLGTFRPVKTENPLEHEMHREYCMISPETAEIINQTKGRGGRVICVGTTSCRTIESFANMDGTVNPGGDWTNIFIYPGYHFRVLDCLITNFHLPESTLIMLVSALSTRERVLFAYQEAIKEKYRFFSFGDSMMIY